MKKWLFNPFEIVAGWSSLLIGLGILLLTALVACYGNIHLDGAIDLHVTDHSSLLNCITEGLINWLSMALFIYIAGLLFSRSSIRLIDVLGTQAMARFPFLVACIFSALFFHNNMLHYIEFKFLHTGQPVDITWWDMVSFALMLLVTILSVIWMFVLMYRAYSIACNVKCNKAIFSFIVCVLLAEVLSKVLLNLFYSYGS